MSGDPNQNQSQPEPYPVDETLKVLKGTDIYKTQKWWCAVLLVNAFGHDKVMVYLWQWKEDRTRDGQGKGMFRWRVQQKMGINFEQNWNDIKKVVDQYLLERRTA